MTKRTFVLNTLVYDDAKNGVSQLKMLDQALAQDIKDVEVRREFFTDPQNEIPALGIRARELGITIYFSIPDVLFVAGGEFNPKFDAYVNEARQLGAVAIKMNIGHFADAKEISLATLKAALPTDIALNIENSQAVLDGTIAPITAFLTYANDEHLGIKFVFDAGNWRYVGEDELIAAEKLASDTTILHLKNVQPANDSFTAVAFDQGIIDWQALIAKLPTTAAIFIEYPVASADALATDIKNLKAAVN